MDEKYLGYQVFLLNNLLTDLEDAIDLPRITYEDYLALQESRMEKTEKYYVANLK